MAAAAATTAANGTSIKIKRFLKLASLTRSSGFRHYGNWFFAKNQLLGATWSPFHSIWGSNNNNNPLEHCIMNRIYCNAAAAAAWNHSLVVGNLNSKLHPTINIP